MEGPHVHNRYQISLIGCAGVGKRAIMNRFIGDYFSEEYDPTIESSGLKQCTIDGTVVVLNVEYPYIRQEEYAIREPPGLRADGALLVYAVTSRTSFEESSKHHDQLLKTKGVSKFPMVLVANKTDLTEKREVSSAEGEQLAKKIGIPFFEVSALNGSNIEATFHALVREIGKFAKEKKSTHKSSKKEKSCVLM